MSALMEISLTSMKAAFPAASDPIQGIPMLTSLIDLMLHICRCSRTQKTPASATMNMLFCAASPAPGLYSFFTNEAYPTNNFPFPAEVDSIPDFSACNSDNESKTFKATNARDRKTRADIVTMNAALSDGFLANLPKAIRETYEPIHMKQPNTVFLHMFDWFITKYGKTMTEDREENRQRMAADWHPALRRASSSAHPTQAWHAIRWTIVTSLTSACASSNDTGCTPRSTKIGSRVRMKPSRSSRQLTPSKNIGPTQSHLSTRQLPEPRNMGMAWPP